MTVTRFISGAAIFFYLFSVTSFAQSPHAIIGKWKPEEKDKQMEMEIYLAKDGKYYGKRINDKSSNSGNGTLIMKSLSYDAGSKTYKGTMSPPDAGISLNVTLSLASADSIKIVARKLVMKKVFYLVRIK